jgi:ABC-type polar amino acid transport system ATPase subunit
VISVRTLSKRHGDRKVLVGVSAEVTKGETIAIVGPSGGGKSTLLRCLNYLETFDEGEVDIAGFKLRPRMVGGEARKTLREMRARVGMVFQQFNLFPHHARATRREAHSIRHRAGARAGAAGARGPR